MSLKNYGNIVMLQYINWLWGGHKKAYNMDKLRRMFAVCKIENVYLAYRSRKRMNEKKNNDINLYIENIANCSNQLEVNKNVTLKKHNKRNKNKNRNRNRNNKK